MYPAHMTDIRKNFLAKIQSGPGGCILWTGATVNGYGVMGVEGKVRKATHVSWFLKHKCWPTQHILHTCDVRACVKPAHLFEGTQLDNMRDMISKGRKAYLRGEDVGSSKLSEQQVTEIRDRCRTNETYTDISQDYDVTARHICAVAKGRGWAHVPGALARKARRYDVGGGESLTIGEIAARSGLSGSAVASRIDRGMRGPGLLRPKHRAPRKAYTRR